MFIAIKRLIPLGVKKYFYNKRIQKKYFRETHVKNEKTIAFLMSPLHNNCGDLAIVQAEKEFFKKYFPQFHLAEIYYNQLEEDFYNRIKSLRKSDVIVLPGGGNLGDLWRNEEEMRVNIVKSLPKNKIISFPQSVYFSDTLCGREQLSVSKKTYEEHKKILFFLRDKKSFEFFKSNFNCPSRLSADIVLSTKKEYSFKRDGVLICVRKDKEKNVENDVIEHIEGFLREKYPIKLTGTLSSETVTVSSIDDVIEHKIKEFASAKLVVTDRLHGMIFSAVTGTPCIVFNNLDGKVFAQHEWIKDLEYIKACNNFDEFLKAFEELDVEKEYSYDTALLEKEFLKLSSEIKKFCKIKDKK